MFIYFKMDLNCMTLVDLKAFAKTKGCSRYSQLNKSDLIKFLEKMLAAESKCCKSLSIENVKRAADHMAIPDIENKSKTKLCKEIQNKEIESIVCENYAKSELNKLTVAQLKRLIKNENLNLLNGCKKSEIVDALARYYELKLSGRLCEYCHEEKSFHSQMCSYCYKRGVHFEPEVTVEEPLEKKLINVEAKIETVKELASEGLISQEEAVREINLIEEPEFILEQKEIEDIEKLFHEITDVPVERLSKLGKIQKKVFNALGIVSVR
jgi:hypothetical protein